MSDQMTSRERIIAAIDHKPVDKIPTDYWGTPEITSKLMKALGIKQEIDLWKRLDIDKIITIKPTYIGPKLEDDGTMKTDLWGIKHRTISYCNGEGEYEEMCHHPLGPYSTIDEIEANYTWPSADWFDFSSVTRQCRLYPDYAIECGYAAPFYMYNNIRGLQESMMDLAIDENLAHYIIGRICDFYYDYHSRLFSAGEGKIDIAQVTDDFGSQNSLLISLDMFDRFFKPHYERFIKLLKSYDIKVFHHDDGSIMPLIPRLVELGIEVLNPIQWHLPGMDLTELKSRFGDKICFHGGIDNQDVLPFGTIDDVKAEVETCLDLLASDGTGYILAPCHNLQIISPIENIVAMYETANQLRVQR